MDTLLVVAGEASGDMYAARVVRHIKNEIQQLRIIGMGGSELSRIGQQQLATIDEDSFGLTGSITGVPTHLKNLRRLAGVAEENDVSAALLVDYSGFNMLLARSLYRRGVPAVHFIPPSIWSWGRWRAKWLGRYDVTAAAIFPREYNLYRQHGVEAEHVGHPLRDEIQKPMDHRRCRRELEGIISNKGGKPPADGEKILALLPGSRPREIANHISPMLAAARRLQEEQYLRPIVAVKAKDTSLVKKSLGNALAEKVEVVGGHTRRVLGGADLGIISSGTATLEAALIGCPQVAVYRADFLTGMAARLLLRSDYISLPNIILNEEIVSELVQKQVKDDIIYDEACKLLQEEKDIIRQQHGYSQIRKKLGEPGATERTAELVIKKGRMAGGFSRSRG